jgi:hypothetical protein
MTKSKQKQGGAAVKRGARAVKRGRRKVKRARCADALATWLERSGLSLLTQAELDAWWQRSRVTLEDMKAMTLTPEDVKHMTP